MSDANPSADAPRRADTRSPADTSPIAFAPGEYPIYLALAAIAIYGCVPETGQMPGVAVFLLCLFAIEIAGRRTGGPLVHLVATGIVLWSGLSGATGRGSAVVGAWFAFWPIVLVVTARLVRPGIGVRLRLVLGVVGGIAAIAVARTGAIEPDTGAAVTAVAIAAPVSAAATAALVSLARPPGR